jgi:hypothetical protein
MESKVEVQGSSCVMKVTKDYVSRDDLSAMAVNQAIEFVVPSDKFESAKSACNQMKLKGKRFSTSIASDLSSITITRLA